MLAIVGGEKGGGSVMPRWPVEGQQAAPRCIGQNLACPRKLLVRANNSCWPKRSEAAMKKVQ